MRASVFPLDHLETIQSLIHCKHHFTQVSHDAEGGLACCSCGKILEMINLKGGKVYLTCHFRGLNLGCLGPVALGLWGHTESRWEHVVNEACSPHPGQEAEKDQGVEEPQYPLQRHTPK